MYDHLLEGITCSVAIRTRRSDEIVLMYRNAPSGLTARYLSPSYEN
jgi:hypothetical protein